MLRAFLPPGWAFDKRSRRPPRDPVNALISFLSILLTNAALGIASSTGVDPYLGVLHGPSRGAPCLVLDLIEEFRPVIVDRTAFALLRRREIRESDFHLRGTEGVLLSERGRRTVLSAFVARMNSRARSPADDKTTSYLRIIDLQFRQLRDLFEGRSTSYRPYMLR